jgi:hypothetical protein
LRGSTNILGELKLTFILWTCLLFASPLPLLFLFINASFIIILITLGYFGDFLWFLFFASCQTDLHPMNKLTIQFYIRSLYLWASSTVSARAFSVKVLGGVLPASELSEGKISVLLPLIDATNHRPLAKVEWHAGKESIGLVVMENLSAGQEVANNYGPRNNEQRM